MERKGAAAATAADRRTTTSTAVAALTLQLAPSVRACNFGGGCSHVSRQAWQPSLDRWSVVPHVSKKPGKVLADHPSLDRIFEIFRIGKTKYNIGTTLVAVPMRMGLMVSNGPDAQGPPSVDAQAALLTTFV